MRIPFQSEPAQRTRLAATRDSRRAVSPSNCVGVPTNIIGTCFFDDGPPQGGFNCAACCGQRHATGWVGGDLVRSC